MDDLGNKLIELLPIFWITKLLLSSRCYKRIEQPTKYDFVLKKFKFDQPH